MRAAPTRWPRFAGARKMKRLEAYEFSVISSLMVVLQLVTPTIPIGFAVAAWALWMLGKHEVRVAFKEQLRGPIIAR
jgi:hypothetical protein